MGIIKAKRDENGKVIIKLYGELKDVTAIVKNGMATAKFFGKQYDILVEGEVNNRVRKEKEPVADPENTENNETVAE